MDDISDGHYKGNITYSDISFVFLNEVLSFTNYTLKCYCIPCKSTSAIRGIQDKGPCEKFGKKFYRHLLSSTFESFGILNPF